MAHVIRYRVDGLAGRTEPVEGTLDRHVNVFFGANGSGKTSLLRILNAAMETETKTLRRVTFTKAEVVIYSQLLDADLTYTLDRSKAEEVVEEVEPEPHARLLRMPDGTFQHVIVEREIVEREAKSRRRRKVPPWVVTTTGDMKKRKRAEARSWKHIWLPTERIFGTWADVQRAMRDADAAGHAEDNFAALANAVLGRFNVQVLEATNRAQSEGLAIMMATFFGASELQDAPTTTDPIEVIQRRVESFIDRQRNLFVKKPQFLKTIDTFKTEWKKPNFQRAATLLNGIEQGIEDSGKPKTELQKLISGLLVGDKSVEFSDRVVIRLKDGALLDPSLLSSGEKHLMLMLMEQLVADESTLLIDEPEISLHVDWQIRLLDTLREVNPTSQLIMATHSPEILAACKKYSPNSVKSL